MARTTCHGTRTNTYHSTAVHAGLKEALQQLLTASTSLTTYKLHLQLGLILSLLLIAKLEVVAMVATQLMSTPTLMSMDFITLLACSILLTTYREACVAILMFAVTAKVLLQLKVIQALRTALLSQIPNTTSVSTIKFRVWTR